MKDYITVIGGGLAGTEAAYQQERGRYLCQDAGLPKRGQNELPGET